jgi:hypothetical protein
METLLNQIRAIDIRIQRFVKIKICGNIIS